MAKGWRDVDFSFPVRFGWQCGKCGASTAADVHAVVDAVARPDLVRKIIDGEIPYQECDSCGTRAAGGLPLLIYSDQAYPQLFFFYPEHTTPENDEAVKKAYVDLLLDRLGPVTAEEAEQGGVVTMPYEAAGVILAPYAGDEPESTVWEGQWTFKPDDGEPPADVRQVIDELSLLTRVPLGRSVADGPRASQVVRLADHGLALLGERELPLWRGLLRTSLGQALPSADEGSPALNVERAIGVLLRAATDFSREKHPELWAAVQFELGRVYDKRGVGDHGTNQHLAIRHLNTVFEVTRPDDDSGLWALARIVLAKIHLELGTQGDPDRIEDCIRALDEVTTVLDPTKHREAWCDATSALAGAYGVRQRGDRALNLEEALRRYERLNEVENAELDPEQWANTQVRLGVLLTKRIRGDHRENSRRARAHFERGLLVYQQVGDQGEESSTYDKLAMVASILDEPREELRCHNAALALRPREAVPHLWARTMAKLGALLVDHPEVIDSAEPARVRRRGLDHVEAAVRAYEGLPVDVELGFAKAQLANVYRRYRAEEAPNDQALLAREVAELEDATARLRRRPDLLRNVAADHGDALMELEAWDRAATAYQLAVAADDDYYRTCLLRTSRESGLRMVGSLHQRAAYAMARAGRLADAVLCLEQGRVRALHEELAPERELLRRVADTDPGAVAEYERAADTVRACESQNRELSRVTSTSDTERATAAAEHALGQRMAEARAAMEEAIERIRRLPGMDSFMARVTLDDIVRAVEPGEPLCYLAAAAPGAVCLVVRHESDPGPALAAVWCQLTETQAQAAATTVMTGTTRIKSVVDELGASLISPLVAALGSPAGVVIVACGALAHLPLHAATLTATGEPLISALSVSHVPSARMLLAARRAVVPRQPTLVGAADSGPDGAILAESEVDLITRLFDRFGAGRVVPGETTALLDALPGGTYVHLACHGEYRPDDPLSSGLDVGGGRVTLADLLDRRPRPLANARLVTLSACETAVVDATLPDEAVGLPAGILLAGAAAVVCTQWRARDTAAVLLMVDFYRRMLAAGDKPAEALRQAQLWLRGATRSELLGLDWLPAEIRERLSSAPERPFGHPYLWAPFTVVGA